VRERDHDGKLEAPSERVGRMSHRYILQYNQVRKQLVAVNKKLRALEESEKIQM